ncbi:hypothetical protein [Paenibacillus tundrae]|uniref:hypothetical protein n=1 Tax=Paenibacillus tundrae TaxID=528187 RepID=UPI0030CE8B74
MSMDHKNNASIERKVEHGVINARSYGAGSGLVLLEILIVSAGLGGQFSSWLLFGGLLIGLAVLLWFKVTRAIVLIILTGCYGYLAWNLGNLFNSVSASVVLSVLALIIFGSLHLNAFLEWRRR